MMLVCLTVMLFAKIWNSITAFGSVNVKVLIYRKIFFILFFFIQLLPVLRWFQPDLPVFIKNFYRHIKTADAVGPAIRKFIPLDLVFKNGDLCMPQVLIKYF